MTAKADKTYTIVEFIAENFMRLKVVRIRPNGKLVEITGKNRQGKSSVLNGILAVFGGKSACPAVPIRKGCDQARLQANCGDIIVTRTFHETPDGDYTTEVVVESASGSQPGSPQTFLKTLLGEFSFDPLEFARMRPELQLEALKRFVPGLDFEEIENADRGDRERRRDIGRLLEQERGAAAAIRTPPDTPEQEIDEAELVAELDDVGRRNAELEQRRANRDREVQEIARCKESAAKAKERAATARRMADDCDKEAAAALDRATHLEGKLAEAGPLPEPVDTADVRRRIDAARATNANVRQLNERMKHHARAQQLAAEVETITARIGKRLADKQAAIAAAQMPIEGLGFGDKVVLYNGLPFPQASDAEQLTVSVAIAVALNPKLRVGLVREGSSLDMDRRQLLAELAEKNGFQIWMETVSSDAKCGFILEDGHLKDETPAAAQAGS